jgi:Rad3-related DNA helicase
LGFWCFNPAFAFKSLLKEEPRSIIFTSGTLTPLSSYESELDVPFPIKRETGHVVDKSI